MDVIKPELDKIPYKELPEVNFTFTIIALNGVESLPLGTAVPEIRQKDDPVLAQRFAAGAEFSGMCLPPNVELVVLETAGVDFLLTKQTADLLRSNNLQLENFVSLKKIGKVFQNAEDNGLF